MSTHKPIPTDSKKVFSGVLFDVYQWQQQMYDGTVATFERLRRADAARVVAIVGDKIMIVQDQQPDCVEPFLGCAGGRLEDGEDPLAGAKRELMEETGMVSDEWILWRTDNPHNKIEWTLYTYIARNCVKEREQSLDGGEKIVPIMCSFDEFLLLTDNPTWRACDMSDIMLRARYVTSEYDKLYKLFFGS